MTRKKRRKYDIEKGLIEEEEEREGEGGGVGNSQSKKSSTAPKTKAKKADPSSHPQKDLHSPTGSGLEEASRELTTGTDLVIKEGGGLEIRQTVTQQRQATQSQRTKEASAPTKPSTVSRKKTKIIGAFFDYPGKEKTAPKPGALPPSSATQTFILSRALNAKQQAGAAISRQRREALLLAARRAERNPAKPILISEKLKRPKQETQKNKHKPPTPEV